MKRLLLISSDCHAGPPPPGYREYLDPQYREAYDQALPIQLKITEERQKRTLADGFLAEWKQGVVATGTRGAWDSAERNRQLDDDGIAGEVIFPDGVTDRNAPPFGAGLAMPTEGVVPELQWAGARAHNRWIAEFCAQDLTRRAGLAVVPMFWDVDEAVREIRWAKEHGLRGILIPPLFGSHPPFHAACYEPIWSTCEELDLVIHTHGGGAPDYGDHLGTIGIYITEYAWWSARPVWFLIWGGVFERHPRLRFVVTELGASWVPELKALMDQRFGDTHFNKKLADFRSHLKLKPSEYFDRNVWVGASVTARSDIENRAAIGVGNMMWGSDFPHPEGSWPETRRFLDESFHDLPEHDARTMLGLNAAQVYGFELAKLEPLVERIGPEPESLKLVPARR